MDFKTHKSISNTTSDILKASTMQVECKLGSILENRGMNQTELSILTGIRQPTINDIIHDKKNTINKQHLIAIMLTLKLTDISDMYEVAIDEKERLVLSNQREEMESLGILQEQLELIQAHKKGLD